jgi:hypothetical protein
LNKIARIANCIS